VLSRPINWDLIRQQYDQMIKYATALRLGTAETEVILKHSEIATNRLEDQEIAVLSLHLLQICLVYINTLMMQQILSERQWLKLMQKDDFRALTPLIWGHINPYGTFRLDMDERLLIDQEAS
jgi:TnpA family transposase